MIQRFVPWNLCAICVAVSLTWILLLVLERTSIFVDPVEMGVLMGMSVTGLMYAVAHLYQKHHLKHLWIARLVVIVGGFLFTTSVLSGRWNIAWLIGVVGLILLVIVSFLLQGVKRDYTILKHLDNCC
ncbi:hypothetical protein HZA85_03920 [Candidatus Uhrbacteria bacterium]|nr:hypothetical protein [Candidatus Uhrbacteria bacterium]